MVKIKPQVIRCLPSTRGTIFFLSCAVAGGVDAIVSGDKDLLDMGCFREIPIISVRDFLK